MMGLCASVSSPETSPSKKPLRADEDGGGGRQKAVASARHHHKRDQPRNMGIGMGVAMMMQQAAQLSGASQYVKPQLDVVSLQNEMRRAKAEGRTVTVINGCVYFDYQLFAQLPPGCDFNA